METKQSKNNLLEGMKDFLKKHSLFQKDDLVMVAVSGGVDSVVLLDLLRKVHPNLMVLHCNFNLRGEESMRDEAFVKNLAKEYNHPVASVQFDTEAIARQQGKSIQETARELRYNWFATIGNQNKPANGRVLTATAHHANDLAETMLNNIFRGGGLKAVAGIPVARANIIRPLLFAEKEDILAYATQHQLLWVEDSSNQEDKYTRNFIRKKILPLATAIYPQVVGNMLQTAERFRQAEVLYNEALALRLGKLKEKDKSGNTRISALKLLKSQPLETIVFACFESFGFSSTQVPEIIKLCHAGSGAVMQSATHQLVRHGHWIYISPKADDSGFSPIVVQRCPASVRVGSQQLIMEEIEAIPSLAVLKKDGPSTVYADAKALTFPLVLRQIKTGDYFYPLGLKKKKKIARFLIDQKIPLHKKAEVWVIESAGRIVWVAGYRLDNRFAITANTRRCVKLSWVA